MGLTTEFGAGPTERIDRLWTAACDEHTEFTAIAFAGPGICFACAGGKVTVHFRGPETRASTLGCPPDTEFFGVDFQPGLYSPLFPPSRLDDLAEAVIPVRGDGRMVIDNRSWELPTPANVDVFVDRLERAGVLRFDPLVEEMRHGVVPRVHERTAQVRFRRAIGIPRRKQQVIDRVRRAGVLLRDGVAIADVVRRCGFSDQAHLSRDVRRYLGHTPTQLVHSTTVATL